MSESELQNTIFPPFKAAADAGVRTFMNSFNELVFQQLGTLICKGKY
jgi:beta-glucosidase-like glycosyl hydrolase